MSLGRLTLLEFLFVCAATVTLGADEPVIDGRKQARAARLAAGAIRLDGRLDDEAWQQGCAHHRVRAGGAERGGGTLPIAMEVRFLFDDNALWVGARMRSAPGVPIQAPMSRRDDGSAGGVHPDRARHLPRSPNRLHVRRHRVGRPPRSLSSERQRRRQRRAVRPGLGGSDAASTRTGGPPSCGYRSRSCASTICRERIWGLNVEAVAAAVERGGLLGRRRPHRARMVVAVRRTARHRRRAADHTPRGAAVRRRVVADERQPRSATIRSTMA